MIVDPAQTPHSGEDGVQTLHLSVAGGITQFGAYVEMLAPGAWSSNRHWHTAEDEFLYMLEGTATLRDDDGMHDLHPGDAVCWRHGDPNAHHIGNRTGDPVRYLIAGSRAAGDICHYPDSGRRQVNDADRWRLVEADGTILREGELPAELRGLPPAWGTPFDGSPAQRLQQAKGRVWETESGYVHPYLGGGLGPYDHVTLGDAGGLTQFGAHLERLPQGSRSSFRHWHEREDELVLILSGTPILIEDCETALGPGRMACWPAGSPKAHCLETRSEAPAVYLVLGTRLRHDIVHYPDHDRVIAIDRETKERRATDSHGNPVEPL
jgi:uncharacterized cupin superfamily protein